MRAGSHRRHSLQGPWVEQVRTICLPAPLMERERWQHLTRAGCCCMNVDLCLACAPVAFLFALQALPRPAVLHLLMKSLHRAAADEPAAHSTDAVHSGISAWQAPATSWPGVGDQPQVEVDEPPEVDAVYQEALTAGVTPTLSMQQAGLSCVRQLMWPCRHIGC